MPGDSEFSSGFHCMNCNTFNFLRSIPLLLQTTFNVQCLLYAPPGSTLKNVSVLLTQCIYLFCTDLGTLIISPHSINLLADTTDDCTLRSMNNILCFSLTCVGSWGTQIPQNSSSHLQILGAGRVTRYKPQTEQSPFRSDLRTSPLSARGM
jgi:hypothetical protein